MSKRLRFVLIPLPAVLVLMYLAAIVAGCGSGSAGAASTGKTSQSLGSAPDFNVESLSGGRISLKGEQGNGKPLVLNFGGSWCGSCKQEAPTLAAAGKKYKNSVDFLFLAVKDKPANAMAFVKNYGFTFPAGLDPNQDVFHDYQQAAGVRASGTPTTFFINKSGAIIKYYVGPLDPQQLDAEIGKILH